MPPRKTAHSPDNNTAHSADSAVASLGFEAAMSELEQLIQAVENNRLPLEETLQSYQRGQQLIARCTSLLRDAEQRIQQFDDDHLSDFPPPEKV